MSAHFLLLRVLPLACAVALPAHSRAGDIGSPAPLDWHCVQEFDAGFHFLCRPRSMRDAEAVSDTAASNAPATSAQHRAPDLRPVAQRGDGEVFSAEAWRVPLHARPTDRAHVVQLLDSVLCSARARCTVHYGAVAVRTARR
jgi:hypothetical protein